MPRTRRNETSMTALQPPPAARWRARRPDELRRDQSAGVAAWEAVQRAAETAEQAAAAQACSREMRLDLDRRMDVVRRQQAALLERTQQQVAATNALLRPDAPPRIVIAHRNVWFRDKVVDGL